MNPIRIDKFVFGSTVPVYPTGLVGEHDKTLIDNDSNVDLFMNQA